MKRFRKALVILLALAMVMSLFAGCNGNSGNNNGGSPNNGDRKSVV